MIKTCAFIGLMCVLICSCGAVPKYEGTNEKSPVTNTNDQWKRSYKENDTYTAPSSDRIERLGFTSGYGSGINGYPQSASGVGSYSPMKIDLGGVVLGAIIGIGALLIVPKVVSAFNGGGYGGNGGNYRSVDGTSDPIGITDMLAKLDTILGQNNLDSTVCMQRAVCSYVRSSAYHYSMGTADQQDQIINAISGNALVDYMLDGTAIKEAIEQGKNLNGDAKGCDTIYPGCPLDKQQTLNILGKLLPSSNGGKDNK